MKLLESLEDFLFRREISLEHEGGFFQTAGVGALKCELSSCCLEKRGYD